MEVRDSRRLTGPNLLLNGPGACLDVALDAASDPPPEACAGAWTRAAGRLLPALGWGGAARATRTFHGGVSLAFAAPVDGLYAACDVNETAWAMAWRALAGGGEDDVDAAIDRLRGLIAAEANPALTRMAAAAAARWVQCLIDPDEASVGLGTGSRTWPVDAIPDTGAVAWPNVHDVPVALITGTNGKSTTVRLVAAMAQAAGRVAGVSTTDWVRVGDDVIDAGDWSGPGGARMALRDTRTEVAVLECARGGLLRRGLAVTRARVAAITNVAADHLGEFGVGTVADLAAVKFIVAKAAAELVLNADDPSLVNGAENVTQPVTWFSLDASSPVVARSLAAGGRAVVLDRDALVLIEGAAGDGQGEAGDGEDGLGDGPSAVAGPSGRRRGRTVVATVDEVPIAFGGAARYNVANALCAVAVAHALAVPPAAIRAGLVGFQNSPEDNPGRLNVFKIGGCTVLVDYAHNPHGMRALADVVATLPGDRRLVVLGQAGDRSDDDLRDLAAATLAMRPDVIIVKELAAMLRGRAPGEVPRVLVAALRDLGVPDGAIVRADDELAAARRALELATAGDVIVLPIHKRREAVVALLQALGESGWRAGESLPAPPPISPPPTPGAQSAPTPPPMLG